MSKYTREDLVKFINSKDENGVGSFVKSIVDFYMAKSNKQPNELFVSTSVIKVLNLKYLPKCINKVSRRDTKLGDGHIVAVSYNPNLD